MPLNLFILTLRMNRSKIFRGLFLSWNLFWNSPRETAAAQRCGLHYVLTFQPCLDQICSDESADDATASMSPCWRHAQYGTFISGLFREKKHGENIKIFGGNKIPKVSPKVMYCTSTPMAMRQSLWLAVGNSLKYWLFLDRWPIAPARALRPKLSLIRWLAAKSRARHCVFLQLSKFEIGTHCTYSAKQDSQGKLLGLHKRFPPFPFKTHWSVRYEKINKTLLNDFLPSELGRFIRMVRANIIEKCPSCGAG